MGLIFDAKDLGYFRYPKGTQVHAFEDPAGYAAITFMGPKGENLGHKVLNPGGLPSGTTPDIALGLVAEKVCLKAQGIYGVNPEEIYTDNCDRLDKALEEIGIRPPKTKK